MPITILVTSERAWGDRPPREWVRSVLVIHPLNAVIHFFTGILHPIEIGFDQLDVAARLLPGITRRETRRGIETEVTRIRDSGRHAAIFSQLPLLNMIKESIRFCAGPRGLLTLPDRDQLLRAYVATHDHFQETLSDPGRSQDEQLKEDFLRQILVSVQDRPMLTIPRYWALWVTLPKRLGFVAQLGDFMLARLPKPVSEFYIPLLALWAFFAEQARSQDARPVTLTDEGWHADVLTRIRAVFNEVGLEDRIYKERLEAEYAAMKAGERWEYSLVTVSQCPLLRIADTYSSVSLTLLMNTFCDGHYHRMLTASAGDRSQVNSFTQIFGLLFHAYVHDLWERIAGRRHAHKLVWGPGEEELGDGVIDVGNGIIIYDAKSRRPKLQVTRSGNLDAFFEDLEKGVLKGAHQLDKAIGKIRGAGLPSLPSGLEINRIFPVVVTARRFPEFPFVYQRIDQALEAQGLLRDDGVAPLIVLDAETLELMEGLRESGHNPLDLLIRKASTTALRAQSLEEIAFQELGSLEWPARMREAFRAAGECSLEWLRTGRIDEARVDAALFPETPED